MLSLRVKRQLLQTIPATMLKRQIIAKSIASKVPMIPEQKLDPEEIRHYFNTYLNREPNTGNNGTVNEYRIYMKHADNKQLIRDLTIRRKDSQDQLKAQNQGQLQGQGGPIDPALFQKNLNSVRTRILGSAPSAQTQRPPSKGASAVQSKTGKGFRTDRNNNPTAMTTDVAAQSGLQYGVDYVQGDAFSGGDGHIYHTAKLLGDPIQVTIKSLDGGGFYTRGGKPRWSYLATVPGIRNWPNLNYNQKADIIANMYQHEGGSGELAAKQRQQPLGVNTNFKTPALAQLGNLTSSFGEKTQDTDFHRGIDVANAQGTPIPKLTPTPGQVSYVGNNKDYGNQVQIQNSDGTKESYGHLSVANVQQGQTIMPGQPIGLMGHSGNAWSPSGGGDPSHLHYELTDAYNRIVDPMKFLNQG